MGVEWCSGCIINNIYLDKPNIVVFDRIESAQNLKGETLGKFLSAKYYFELAWMEQSWKCLGDTVSIMHMHCSGERRERELGDLKVCLHTLHTSLLGRNFCT